MAFSYDGRGLPLLNSYARALEFWETAYRWSDEPVERVLDSKRKKFVTIRKLNDNSIACRLHHTDVVTFHPDNSISIMPYQSVSTDEFFNRLGINGGLDASFNRGMIRVGERVYRAVSRDALRISLDTLEWRTQPEPFVIRTIDRKRAKAARDLYDYAAFAGWARMLDASQTTPEFRSGWFNPQQILTQLQDRNEWPTLIVLGGYGRGVNANATIKHVRDAIYYRHPDVYDKEVKPYLTSWTEVEKWKRSK